MCPGHVVTLGLVEPTGPSPGSRERAAHAEKGSGCSQGDLQQDSAKAFEIKDHPGRKNRGRLEGAGEGGRAGHGGRDQSQEDPAVLGERRARYPRRTSKTGSANNKNTFRPQA